MGTAAVLKSVKESLNRVGKEQALRPSASASVLVQDLSNADMLTHVEATRDPEAFRMLFTRMEIMVRNEILKMGSEIRIKKSDIL